MLYLIGPDGLVNLSFENFPKIVWMTMTKFSSMLFCCLHTLELHDMHILSDFITNRVLRNHVLNVLHDYNTLYP